MSQDIPRSNRFHIGLFGRRNTGKSSLANALCGQQVAVVSDVPGTTTDVVLKNMELPGIGAAVLVDTAGFDDEGELGLLRVEQTRKAAARVDLALMVVAAWPEADAPELEWARRLSRQDTPVIWVCNCIDRVGQACAEAWRHLVGQQPVCVSARTGQGIDSLRQAMADIYRQGNEVMSLTAHLVHDRSLVVLVMPQDAQAPKGRLILPQVQTLRELLDRHCIVVSCAPEELPQILTLLGRDPDCVITDSQVFAQVDQVLPAHVPLTSFSVLFARQKGDMALFVQGAQAMMRLPGHARVLIAEACTHVPQHEDIGRVKLPRLLRARLGQQLSIEVVSGNDFPDDVSAYDLVIHCGACMFTRRHVLNRVRVARAAGVPVTNYGLAIAALTGILERITVR